MTGLEGLAHDHEMRGPLQALIFEGADRPRDSETPLEDEQSLR